ncbi:MAG: S26 family signal peptidase [Halobacteriales archaeon]
MPAAPPDAPLAWLRWLASTDHPWVRFAREVLSSAVVVLLVGALLFAISGVWPPLVAVESGSMEPHMFEGDLVFVMDEGRLVPEAAVHGTGVVTYRAGKAAGYRTFGSYGDVIVFDPPAEAGPPIIHRARFWVDAGENWYDRADPAYIRASRCGDSPDENLPNCPAPHAGFITRGDANNLYDQVSGIGAGPVRTSWIKGTAEVRIPYLGYVRLMFAEWAGGLLAPMPGLAG